MKYAYSQKWTTSQKTFSLEIFHWKHDLYGDLNNWTLTAVIFPQHNLYKPLLTAFHNKKYCYDQLGVIIPFFYDNCSTFDKTRYAIKVATEYTDITSIEAFSKKEASHIFYDMESLFEFLKETASCKR